MGMDTQNDTRVGDLPLVAGEDLTGMEGMIAKITNAAGQVLAKLPDDPGDIAVFVVIEGNVAGKPVNLRPLEQGRNVRLRLSRDVKPGDVLVAADPTDPLLRGMVTPLTGAPGTYRGIAIAEEYGDIGQLVLARPVAIGNVVVV